MDYSDFEIDPASSAEARHLADNLSYRHDDMLNRQIPESFQRIFGFSMDHLIQGFAEPLENLEKEIALQDVRNDVVDFGLMTAAVAKKTKELPVMLLGAKVEPEVVPLLPAKDTLTSLSARDLLDSNPESLFAEILPESRSSRQKYVMRPVAFVQNLFFQKLSDFLTARIAGTRFHERQVELGKGEWRGKVMYATAGGQGGGTVKINHPEQQEWKVHARKSSEHSVYYTPVHATRPFGDRKTLHSYYLNGLTPWVDVLLNYGEVYLGSDIGTDDDPIFWDDAKLTVPRSIPEGQVPIYHAMRF